MIPEHAIVIQGMLIFLQAKLILIDKIAGHPQNVLKRINIQDLHI